MLVTEKMFTDYVTSIHLDVRELTSEERVEHEVPDISVNEDGIEYHVEAWTATDYFLHHNTPMPDKDKVRQIIINHIDSCTDNRILSGFVWRDIPVWLSMENQFNYKGAYDLAVQTGGATLPITFKLGERDGRPVYFTFEDMETFTDFYISAIAYKNACLESGWAKKDSIDFDNLL